MKQMKYLQRILLAAIASLPIVSCVEETITKGEQENDSYGIHFKELTPDQKNVEFDPDQTAELSFTAMRTKEDDNIVVPLKVVATTDKNEDATSLFDVEELSFEEGQTEKEFKISFPEAKLGVTYKISVTCDDPKYVKIYANVPTSFSFNVTRVKWNPVVGKNKEEFGSWTDDLFRSAYNVPKAINDKIKIEERADKPGYYRIADVYNPYMIAQFVGATPEEVTGNCTPGTMTYIDATNPDKVYIKEGTTGATLNPDEGYLIYASACAENGFQNSMYGTLKDGVIRFPVNSIAVGLTGMPGNWYNGNTHGETTIVLPGYRDFDYSLELQTALSNNGKLPFMITPGADLAKANYQFFEGKIANADIPFKALEVARNPEAENVTESKKLEATLAKTGVYTLIVAGLDKDNNMQNYRVAEIGYVAAGDTKPVMLSCGIGSAAKYTPQGISTDTAVEVYLYGQELVDVKLAVVPADRLASDQQGVIKDLLKMPSVSAKILNQINNDGFSGVVDKLMPGTEYVIVAYASNGFEEAVIASDESETTTGKSDPIQQNFTDVDEGLLPQTKDKYYGTYNVYAISSVNQTGLRERVGQVILSDGGKEGEHDYVKIENLWEPLSSQINIDDSFMLEFGEGILYTTSAKFGQSNFQNLYAANVYFIPGTNQYYPADASYAMYTGFADEGFMPFFSNVDKPLALTLGMYKDAAYKEYAGQIEMLDNLMLVDVNKDESAQQASLLSASYLKLNETQSLELNGAFIFNRQKTDASIRTLHSITSKEIKGMHKAAPVNAEVNEYSGSFESQTVYDGNPKLRSELKAINK